MKIHHINKYSLWGGLGVAFLTSFLFTLTPLWYLAILAGMLGGFWSQKTGKAIFSGSLGVLLGWGLSLSLKILNQHTHLLLNQIAGLIFGTETLGFLLIIGILVMGAILGLLGGIIGNSLRVITRVK